MKLRAIMASALLIGATMVMAGPKEDFEAQVKKSCPGKNVPATGGRQGNVMKWKTCTADSITLEGCTLKCGTGANQIGG